MLGIAVSQILVFIIGFLDVGFCQNVNDKFTPESLRTTDILTTKILHPEVNSSNIHTVKEFQTIAIDVQTSTKVTDLLYIDTKTTVVATTKPTTAQYTTTQIPKFKTTAKATTTKKLPEGVESPYAGGYDKFKVFAECCWELRLLYYWECDLWMKQCCMDSDITEYKPVCSSTGPGYRMWWKPYRRIFYNECAATKYLCESLPPLSVPWKCMWRRDKNHPHCKGSNKDVIRETKPPVMDCSRYGLKSIGQQNEVLESPEINFYKHPENDPDMPKWKLPYPEITLSKCGDVQRPKEPEPVLVFPPTTAPPIMPLREIQELQELRRIDKLRKTTTGGPLTSQTPVPPLFEIRTPDEEKDAWIYKMSLWAILLGVFTVLFIAGCFMFSLWFGSKVTTEEQRRLRQS